MCSRKILIGATALIAFSSVAYAAQAPALKAGAAKVDITPPASALPPGGFVRDPVFARVIYVSNGTTCAVLAGIDEANVSNETYNDVADRGAKALGCPGENIMISATHTHSGSSGAVLGDPQGGEPSAKRIADAIIQAAQTAKAAAQPARIGYGKTNVYLSVNRDLFANNRWNQGVNEAGPSDKTLSVVEFIAADNNPIAVYMNYGMHPVNFYLAGLVSADFAGAASRYIERRYNDKVVAVFSQAASGDQNPLLAFQRYKISGIRAGVPQIADMKMGTKGDAPWEMTADMLNSNQTMMEGLKKPVADAAAYKQAVAEDGEIVDAEGAIIGESTLDVMRLKIPYTQTSGSIWADHETVTCPGRDRLDTSARQGVMPPYKDGAPVVIREGLIRLGDVNFLTVNGEVYTDIVMRMKAAVPSAKTVVATITNGRANSGYIYSNEAATHLTFQVIGSRLKPYCAEDSMVKTAVSLMHKADHVAAE